MEQDSCQLVFLTDVSYDFCRFLEPLFFTNNIPFVKRYKDSSQAMVLLTGYSITGVEIYVPKDVYDQANELLDYLEKGSDFEIENE